MIEADCDRIGKVGLSHAHDRVGATPIDLDGAIGFGDGAAGENHVVKPGPSLPSSGGEIEIAEMAQ